MDAMAPAFTFCDEVLALGVIAYCAMAVPSSPNHLRFPLAHPPNVLLPTMRLAETAALEAPVALLPLAAGVRPNH